MMAPYKSPLLLTDPFPASRRGSTARVSAVKQPRPPSLLVARGSGIPQCGGLARSASLREPPSSLPVHLEALLEPRYLGRQRPPSILTCSARVGDSSVRRPCASRKPPGAAQLTPGSPCSAAEASISGEAASAPLCRHLRRRPGYSELIEGKRFKRKPASLLRKSGGTAPPGLLAVHNTSTLNTRS
ncbi:hypothetical protein NDU88_008428 [Pleurodeles waltl]|uniref:Uncharacterized protein n=1 Tax=Pleurodeles waltl TaxID=8319 RepID=A0AAV7RSC1_PLEWA|nr:hypothetical protein NDU88_008428 [Pleurodeles waltl]